MQMLYFCFAVKYPIHPGSALDIPKHLLIGVGDFRARFMKYLEADASNREVMIAFAYAYQSYLKHGQIRFVSSHKVLGAHHQEVLQTFFERELEHIAKLYQFTKAYL